MHCFRLGGVEQTPLVKRASFYAKGKCSLSISARRKRAIVSLSIASYEQLHTGAQERKACKTVCVPNSARKTELRHGRRREREKKFLKKKKKKKKKKARCLCHVRISLRVHNHATVVCTEGSNRATYGERFHVARMRSPSAQVSSRALSCCSLARMPPLRCCARGRALARDARRPHLPPPRSLWN